MGRSSEDTLQNAFQVLRGEAEVPVSRFLSVSNEQLDAFSLQELGSALVTNPHGLVGLRLSSCRLGDEGARALADALQGNTALQTLELTGTQPLQGFTWPMNPGTWRRIAIRVLQEAMRRQ